MFHQWKVPSGKRLQFANLKMSIEIVDLPISSMVIFFFIVMMLVKHGLDELIIHQTLDSLFFFWNIHPHLTQ